MKITSKKVLTKQGSFAILSSVAARVTTAILENDIVRETNKNESSRRPGRLRGRNESEQETVRFLRETTELGNEFCEGLNIRV